MINSISFGRRKGSVRRQNWLNQLARTSVLAMLQRLEVGHLVLEEGDQVYTFGQSLADTSYHAHITIHDGSAYRDIMNHCSIGAGEAYMKGLWSSPDVLALLRLMVANLALVNEMDATRPIWSRLASKCLHYLNANTRTGSKKNISAHYDLGNDFFELFLDPTMMYSAAIYPDANASLEQASLAKLEHICQKLQLKKGDHLLEIGTGWGGMAIYAAQHYGCHVTTTTISQQQYDYAKARVKALGLENNITLLLQDYRDLTGQYDKLVSIEMIEAVGHEFYDSYFSKCSSLLKQNGLMVIQAITMIDQRYEYAKGSVDLSRNTFFPVVVCLPMPSLPRKWPPKPTCKSSILRTLPSIMPTP